LFIFVGIFPSYKIPTFAITTYINSASFLLLNNEFHNQTTYLNGFQINAAVAGTVNIAVKFFLIFNSFLYSHNILIRLLKLINVGQ